MSNDPARELSQNGFIAEHRELYLKDGEAGHIWDSTVVGGPGLVPTLLLFTRGRKSGKDSIMPLIYSTTGAGYVIVASKGGYPTHPGWYHNLQAQPEAQIKVKNDTFKVRHRVAKGAERQKLRDQLAQLFPSLADYEKSAAKANREIPIIVLEKV
jgi:deazaflavin-dependent oxidoreductase (nitroreductase family)